MHDSTIASVVELTFRRGALVLAVASALAACGDDDPPAETRDDAAVRAMSDSATPDPAPARRGLKVEITVPDVPPGTEGTKCVQVRLGNDAAVDIGRVHNRLEGYSHHFIVSMLTDPEASERELFDCPPFRAQQIGAPLTVTQKHDEEIVLPDGVAYALAEDQLMHLELHYINTSSETVDVRAESELFPSDATGPLQEAGFLIVGTMNIEIPPNATHDTGDLYIAAPAALEGVHYYAFTGHTHQRGTSATLGIAENASAEPEMVYAPSNFDWSGPEVRYLDPPLQVPAGGGFRFRCEWNNPTDQTIRYGESALTEMCFFWGYYYPKHPRQQTLIIRPGATSMP